MGEQTEEERVSVMSKNIIDGLRYAYEAYCRGDIEGAVDAIDVDPDILWIEPKEFYAGGTYLGREARHRLPHARVFGELPNDAVLPVFFPALELREGADGDAVDVAA